MSNPDLQSISTNRIESESVAESPLCEHLLWLKNDDSALTTSEGKQIRLFSLRHNGDAVLLSSWARHIRNHYCPDTEIDILRRGTGLTRREFLRQMKLPTDIRGFGPGIRAGDFGEILIADYLEFRLGYWVPRTRYDRKTIRDESTKGSDLIGFKFAQTEDSPNDILSIFEVKAQFSGKSPRPRLQDAVDDSIKDEIRKAESLNAIKQRLYDQSKTDEMLKVERFQNPVDRPYIEQPGAAALFSSDVFDRNNVTATTVTGHPLNDRLELIVVYGEDLMNLVHQLYEIAANEA